MIKSLNTQCYCLHKTVLLVASICCVMAACDRMFVCWCPACLQAFLDKPALSESILVDIVLVNNMLVHQLD